MRCLVIAVLVRFLWSRLGVGIVHQAGRDQRERITSGDSEFIQMSTQSRRDFMKRGGATKKTKLDLVRGSGNVFRDLGRNNTDVEQLKAILAAEIIKVLDRQALTVRGAHDRTGIAAADFSRIRNADLGRFTLDRLMSILNRLGSRVEVKVRVQPVQAATQRISSLTGSVVRPLSKQREVGR